MCHSSLTDFVSELVAGNSLFFPDGGLGGRGGGWLGVWVSGLTPMGVSGSGSQSRPPLVPPLPAFRLPHDVMAQGCLRTGFSDTTDLQGVRVVEGPLPTACETPQTDGFVLRATQLEARTPRKE